jgi:dUTP pyrophosphatase
MILEFRRRPGAKVPSRSNPSDAGLDVFYCPKDPNVSVASLNPGQNMLFPTGLEFGIPHGYMLQVCNRSSMGAKKSLVVGAHIVDSGYAGEIFVDLHNIGTEVQHISAGDKIAQLILVPVVHFRANETIKQNLYTDDISMSNRGDGSLGSTDRPVASSTADLHERDARLKAVKALKDYVPNGW